MKRVLVLFLAALLLSGCAAAPAETKPEETVSVMATTAAPTEPQTEPTTQPTETDPQPEVFTLTFTGDCTFGSNPSNSYALCGFPKVVGENWAYPFANVIDYFVNDDYSLVNFEGTLCESGYPVPKAHNFRGPCAYVNILTENSIEAVTLANNHSLDYGVAGYESTVATLQEAGIPYVEENSSAVFTTESGLTIGIYGTVYYSLDMEDMLAEIAALKEQGVDLIIFAPHWGAENYYEPNNVQKKFGYAAIDAGAHIVWGSHPHVLQPIEEYNGGIIYYSLGNFSFGGNIAPKDFDTALIQQEVIREPDGTVHLGQMTAVPCRISSEQRQNNFQPTPYPEDSPEYTRVMKKLGLAE